jgi:hypothetical protein
VGNLEKERKWRRQRRATTAIAVFVLAACLATTADAIRMQVGDIVVNGDGHVIPSKLPKYENAPIRLKMHGKLSTISGELPPIFKHLRLEVDGDGDIETDGLPACLSGKLQSRTVREVREICGKSIIGTGSARALVAFPDQRPIDITSPLTIFNGPSSANRWAIYVHAYITVPVPAAIIVKVDVRRIDNGPFGYLIEATIPSFAGGAGIPISAEMEVGHEWRFKGRKLSYLNGRCEDGKIQAKGAFTFKDGTIVTGAFLKPCSVRP